MNKNNSQSGFGVVEILLLLVIVGIIGFTGWRVYEANREVSQVPVDNSTVVKKPAGTIPQGWKKYENKDLGFSFAYPQEWGEVVVTNGYTPYTGGHYYFNFSKNDQFTVAAKTTDYVYTGGGRDAPQVDGFTNFDKKYQEALTFEQGTNGNVGETIEKTDNFIVYTYAEGLTGSIHASGIVKTSKLPGLEFGLTIPVDTLNLSDDTVSKLFEGKASAKQYLSQKQLDTVVSFAKNVKSL